MEKTRKLKGFEVTKTSYITRKRVEKGQVVAKDVKEAEKKVEDNDVNWSHRMGECYEEPTVSVDETLSIEEAK